VKEIRRPASGLVHRRRDAAALVVAADRCPQVPEGNPLAQRPARGSAREADRVELALEPQGRPAARAELALKPPGRALAKLGLQVLDQEAVEQDRRRAQLAAGPPELDRVQLVGRSGNRLLAVAGLRQTTEARTTLLVVALQPAAVAASRPAAAVAAAAAAAVAAVAAAVVAEDAV
jgi:hypothetical protein